VRDQLGETLVRGQVLAVAQPFAAAAPLDGSGMMVTQ
jgi:hypothetical protein